MLGSWHSWGGRKFPRLTLKPEPLIYDSLPNFPAVSLLAKPQELPVTQLARHVNLFHLVITDNQRPESLSLPHGLAPPMKPTTHFSQAASLCTQKEWQSCSLVPINLSFSQFLTPCPVLSFLEPNMIAKWLQREWLRTKAQNWGRAAKLFSCF
jgi:hypothetical protein